MTQTPGERMIARVNVSPVTVSRMRSRWISQRSSSPFRVASTPRYSVVTSRHSMRPCVVTRRLDYHTAAHGSRRAA
jgi:hypothetical protein